VTDGFSVQLDEGEGTEGAEPDDRAPPLSTSARRAGVTKMVPHRGDSSQDPPEAVRGQVKTKGDSMAVITGSIEADVPLEFADLEWGKFVFESLYGSYSRGFADVEPLLDEQDMNAGDVRFETEGDRLVRVTVELEYVPRTTDTAQEEIARAEATLRRDLEKYRLFLLERCERESCRPR